MTKSLEIERSVDDILGQIVGFPIDSHVRGVSESEIIKVKAHYNWSLYQALLNATKESLNTIKDRLAIKRLQNHPNPLALLESQNNQDEEEKGSGDDEDNKEVV